MKKSNDPFWWTLFGAGGTLSAFFMPVLAFLFTLAFPLGWVQVPDYTELSSLIQHPIAKLFLLALLPLSLFHWAHRFRFTLYDGLQIKHLNELIAVICYGGAIAGTGVAAYFIWIV